MVLGRIELKSAGFGERAANSSTWFFMPRREEGVGGFAAAGVGAGSGGSDGEVEGLCLWSRASRSR